MDYFFETAKSLAILFCTIVLIFLSILFLDGERGLVAAAMMLSCMFGLLIYFFLSFITKPVSKRNPSVLLWQIVYLLVSGASLTAMTIANEALYKVLPHSSLMPWNKIYFYKEALLYKSEGGYTRLNYLESLIGYSKDGMILYFGKEEESLARNMVLHSREVKKIMTAFTGDFQLKPVNVIFYSNPLIFQANVPEHSFDRLKGMYVPNERTIHLFIGENERMNEEALLKRFAHEYSHHIIVSYLEFHGLDNRHLPRWFEEGTAEYAAEKSVRLRPPFRPLNIIPFKKIHTQTQWEKANQKNSPHHPYKQSFYAVDELIQLAGARQVGRLMITSSSGSFYESFEKASEMSLEDFQISFLAEEMKTYSSTRTK